MGTSAAVGGTGSRWNNITIADQGLHELLMLFAALLVVLISSHHLLLLPHTAAAAAATTGYMNQRCGTSGAVLAASAATVAINTLNFSTSNLTCIDKMWPSGSPDNHFLLWSQHDNITNVVSIVVAMPLASPGRWAALGFSKDSYMIGSTAVVARLTTNSPTATATEYFLKDKIANQVFPDRTGLSFVMAPKSHYDAQNKIMYMAFQVNFMKSVASPNYLLYAYGPLASDGSLQIHDSHYAFPSPFVAGVSGDTPLASRPQLANAHGAIQVIGWGLLLPIGALLARYCRAWDPIWFYLHVTFQIIGFMFVIAGIGTGLVLSKRVRPSRFYTHQALGITVFFLACLQVLALLFRPKKDAKLRQFWNWYHECVGRIALILAVGNIFLGMHMADAQHSLRVGYAIILTLELLATLVLEFMLWLQWKKLSTWDAFAPETKSDLFTFAGGA
jgi:hypothetical protein